HPDRGPSLSLSTARREPTVWPSSLRRAISAVANRTPKRFSIAMMRLMCISESQPSTSALDISSRSSRRGSPNTWRNTPCPSSASVGIEAHLPDVDRAFRSFGRNRQLPGRPSPFVLAALRESEARIVIADERVLRGRDVLAPQDTHAPLAGDAHEVVE